MAKKGYDKLTLLYDHYNKGRDDMDTRRTRKNGWNEVINAYMSKLPNNWPYTTKVTDPRIRTTILEKTARLLNSKLQGRLIPREGGDVTKARINNAILDYQWDNANEGGAMIEKVALADQVSRIYGASFAYVYWDIQKECNEIKICDPRDIFIDYAATHIRNAKWVQYREFTTLDQLEARGYDVAKVRKLVKTGQDANSDQRNSLYESVVKQNRNLEDRLGQDLANPVVELITEYTKDGCVAFLPRYGEIVKDGPNPYKHGLIPFAQLRYYPLGDDVYGESEVESVLPLQRAINAVLCGFLDEMNITMRPPLKISSSGVRIETIEYGPGARWIMQSPNLVEQMQFSGNAVNNFNNAYPALVAAFNTAMGDQSLGTSNVGGGGFQEKTATEVASLEKQQNNRDQYNQLYLGEFLKDIMMMWLSNNKQYLFDDPEKKYHIIKIIGKDNIKQFQSLLLDEKDIPEDAMNEITETVMANPDAVSDEEIMDIMTDVAVPTNPVITNPDSDPEEYDIKNKLEVNRSGDMADLYVTPEDMDYQTMDYIPDVKSMAAGAGIQMQAARQQFMERVLNPQVQAMLQTQGEMIKMKELLVTDAEDAGYKDAESLFQPIQQPALGPGQVVAQPGQPMPGVPGVSGMEAMSPAIPPQPGAGGIPQPQGLPNTGEVNPGLYA